MLISIRQNNRAKILWSLPKIWKILKVNVATGYEKMLQLLFPRTVYGYKKPVLQTLVPGKHRSPTENMLKAGSE